MDLPSQAQPSREVGARKRTGPLPFTAPDSRRRPDPLVGARPAGPVRQIQQFALARHRLRNRSNCSTWTTTAATPTFAKSNSSPSLDTVCATDPTVRLGQQRPRPRRSPNPTVRPRSTPSAQQIQLFDLDSDTSPAGAGGVRVRRGCWIGGRRRWGRSRCSRGTGRRWRRRGRGRGRCRPATVTSSPSPPSDRTTSS